MVGPFRGGDQKKIKKKRKKGEARSGANKFDKVELCLKKLLGRKGKRKGVNVKRFGGGGIGGGGGKVNRRENEKSH